MARMTSRSVAQWGSVELEHLLPCFSLQLWRAIVPPRDLHSQHTAASGLPFTCILLLHFTDLRIVFPLCGGQH